jgi:hypothetical protein
MFDHEPYDERIPTASLVIHGYETRWFLESLKTFAGIWPIPYKEKLTHTHTYIYIYIIYIYRAYNAVQKKTVNKILPDC